MNIALWIAQILLAATFLTSGAVKISQPKKRLIATGQTGVAPFPVPIIRIVAACELLAVPGLILPRLADVAPVLTPLAAVGLAIFMVGAAISHSRLLRADLRAGRGGKEARNVAVNLSLLALSVLVAVGRF